MEYIFVDKGDFYKLDEKLNLTLARQEKIIWTQPLVKKQVEKFSADIDALGNIHIAAVIGGALTYIKFEKNKTSTTHLMHLPENFSVLSLIINCEKTLRLNYTVKSREGCALIEYTKSGENWQGKNILTCREDLYLKYVKKNKNQCYVTKKAENSYVLINAYEPDEELFYGKINEVLGVFDGIVFTADDHVYYNGAEISKGQKVYTVDSKRVLIKDNDTLKEFSLDKGSRFSGEAILPRGREYIICVPENDKRKIISAPYPYVRLEPEMKQNSGLFSEIYMQQRTIFSMQAEIRSLKQRISALENAVKNR